MSIEVLSPAGNPEKLKIAVEYGADAVYMSGKTFGPFARCQIILRASRWCLQLPTRIPAGSNAMSR
ncbi:MAG: hypothetical protein LKM40_07975 [Mageeibacillus sp.]|nr:hypothetical protein [Mageeibacillus sp.]